MAEIMPEWDVANLMNHFNQHGHKFPYPSFREYEMSSMMPIVNGRRFHYREPKGGQRRIGYYDLVTGYLTIVSANGRRIISHYPATVRYVRSLPESTYE